MKDRETIVPRAYVFKEAGTHLFLEKAMYEFLRLRGVGYLNVVLGLINHSFL